MAMRDKAKRTRKPGPQETMLVKMSSQLTDEAVKQVMSEVMRTVGQLHPGMIPPVLSEIGAQLIMNGLCLDHNMPEGLKPMNPDPQGPTSQVMMLEHVLAQISKVAAEHGVALSYRVTQT